MSMINMNNIFKKSTFVKNVLIVMSGTVLAQIITFALMPIVTRIYGPEPIGVLGTFTAIATFLNPVITLAFPFAIVISESDKEARAIGKLSLMIALLLCLLLSLILCLLPKQITNLFLDNEFYHFIFILPFFVLINGFFQVIEQWIIRLKHFRVQAKTSIFQSLFTNGSKIGIGIVYPYSISLIIIQGTGVLLRAGLMLLMTNKSIINKNESPTFKEIKELAYQYKDFPLYRSPQIFINAVSQGLPILLFSSFFGPAIAGFYSLGKQALNTPVQLLGKAVQDVFYPKINELVLKKTKITPVVLKAVFGLLAIGILPFGIITFFGPWIFSIIFGYEWFTAGEYARWISLVSLSMLITRPIIATIPVLGIQKLFLIIEIVGTVGKTIAILIGIFLFNEAFYSVVFFSIASILMYLILTLITLLECKKFDSII